MKTHKNISSTPPPFGWSLLEVLVALMVLSVGLMGLMTLHWRSVQQSHIVMGQTLASLHAQNVAEQMWLETCWNATQAEHRLQTWSQQPHPTLAEWQASWAWHTSHAGWTRLEISQQWARMPEPFVLTFTLPTPPCKLTP